MPVVLLPPPLPRSGGGGRDRAARGIVDAVAVAVAQRCRKKIRRFLRTTVIDGALSASAFRALQCAFRTTSRYRSEFYHYRRSYSESTNNQDDDDNNDDEGATRQRKRRRTTTDNNNLSSFASHNIPLPADDDAALPDQLLRRSKSLLEQVAILVRRRLA